MTMKTVETLAFDLVVVGGGLSGLCAAIAAAREGVKVALVQDRPVFGGNCSSEIRVVPHGANHSNAWAAETGLPLALIVEDRAHNHEAFPDHGMINASWDFSLLEAARREPNLTHFLNTHVDEVESDATAPELDGAEPTANGLGRVGGGPRRITAVVGNQMGSERRLRFVAPQFIDATGDGTVGFLAGAAMVVKRVVSSANRSLHSRPTMSRWGQPSRCARAMSAARSSTRHRRGSPNTKRSPTSDSSGHSIT
jgi:hypothetical protein